MSTPTDEILWERVRKTEDMNAYRQIFDRHFVALQTFATRLCTDPDVATDVVQNVFINIYEKRSETIIGNVRSFLFGSVRNACLNVLKHEKVKRLYEKQNPIEDLSDERADQLIEQSEAEAKIANALSQLPAQCRRIFEMSRFDGLSNQEIADSLDISKRTVETQISNALRILRQILLSLLIFILHNLNT